MPPIFIRSPTSSLPGASCDGRSSVRVIARYTGSKPAARIHSRICSSLIRSGSKRNFTSSRRWSAATRITPSARRKLSWTALAQPPQCIGTVTVVSTGIG